MTPAIMEHPLFRRLSRIPNQKINFWLVLVCVVSSIYLLSQITWHVVERVLQPQKGIIRPAIEVATKVSHAKPASLNMRAVANAKIFGEKPKEVVTDNTPKPDLSGPIKESRLNAKLRAVFATEDEKLANATIEVGRGEQNVYFIGDKVEGAELVKVEATKVIVRHNGELQSIKMEEFAPLGSGPIATESPISNRTSGNRLKRVVDKRKDRRATAELRKLKEQLQTDPTQVADFITGQPYMKDGQFAGFKIRPGKNRRLFSRLGLRSNDVVTGINGTVLDSPQAAMAMMGQLNSVQELSLTVLRGEQEVSLQFSLKD